VPLTRWLPWALGCEAKALWAWDDPLPMVATVATRAAGALQDRVRPTPG
jgi:hypothetical protein